MSKGSGRMVHAFSEVESCVSVLRVGDSSIRDHMYFIVLWNSKIQCTIFLYFSHLVTLSYQCLFFFKTDVANSVTTFTLRFPVLCEMDPKGSIFLCIHLDKLLHIFTKCI